jgi:penicillin-binding protein 1A
MKNALADQPPTPFRMPPGIDLVSVNPYSGTLTSASDPQAILEAFKAGSEPGLATNAPLDNSNNSNNSNPSNDVSQGTGGLY